MQEASRTQLTNEETNQDTSSLESEVSKIATGLVIGKTFSLLDSDGNFREIETPT